MHMVMPILSDVGAKETRARCATAMDAFAEAGVTTVVEMALDPETLEVMAQMRDADELSTRIVAHMIVHRTGDSVEELAGVAQAAEFKAQFDDDRLRVVGIKLITDGTVDGCTAALREPYTNGSNESPIWDAAALNPVVVGADAAGLQVAVHAIGDQAIGNALDAFELAKETNGTTSARHRIEHLEYATDEDIARLGQLGITASMQPVHADPTILENWSALMGPKRSERGFAWPLYIEAGAALALGTDTPTAPLEALPNMYLASTRRAPTDPTLAPHRPDWALPLEEALRHATSESAWAAFLENRTGSLQEGLAADIVVLTRDPLADGPAVLLETDVAVTIADGRVIHRRPH